MSVSIPAAAASNSLAAWVEATARLTTPAEVVWIVDRVGGRAGAEDTPVGLVPRLSDINLEGLETAGDGLRAAMAIKRDDWSAELRSQDEFFSRLNCELPREIEVQHEALAAAFEL